MRIILKSPTVINRSFSPESILGLFLKSRQLDLKPPSPDFKTTKLKISKSNRILIYGDYDVDGITATAILWQSLYRQGYHVTPFIPHRETDGYGFKVKSFFRFQREKQIEFDTIVTVDNGIVAQSEFEKLKNKIKIIVIDHHLIDKNKPKVSQIIHSPDLAAAGLAYFVARHFDSHPDLGLAALGTVADCLPLTGINRSLVFHGLKELKFNPSPGIKKLIEISGIKRDSLSAYDLGFLLGPRINAVGRLADPTDALRLLCAPNLLVASKYAAGLNRYNQERQDLQKKDFQNAESKINTSKKLLFISGPYNPGIIGLLAGRLTEKYYLPSIVIAQNGDIAKGSCRSIKELNIINCLRQLSSLFIDLGGHPTAAGFSIRSKNIFPFKNKITKIINQKLKNKILEPTIEVDAQIELSAVTPENIKIITQLEPFGIGNPKPLFLLKNLKIISKRLLGQNNDHLKLKLDDPKTKFPESVPTDAIAFKKGELDQKLKTGSLINLIAHLDLNTWNGNTTPQLIVKEII